MRRSALAAGVILAAAVSLPAAAQKEPKPVRVIDAKVAFSVGGFANDFVYDIITG